MRDKLKAVDRFHEVFKVGKAPSTPRLLPFPDGFLRYNLMKEENDEYLEALAKNDMVEIADALGDQLYILCGTILKHGLQHKIDEVFDEIHSSNMSKLDKDGNPIFREDGKVMKGEGYFKPDIKKILS